MATLYADSAAPGGGNGTEALPYNTIPGNALGSNDWFIRAGSVFALGASQLTAGNNCTARKWGSGANPVFTFTGEGFSSATATGNVLLENIDLVRLGSRGGTGVNFTQMSGAGASATLRGCSITNWTACVQGDRCRKLTVEDCTLAGNNGTYGIRGRAHATVNCDGWSIQRNTFDCGIDLELFVSNTDCSLGSFNDLHIADNVSSPSGASGTSILLGNSSMNATDYGATASITGAGSGGGNLVRNANSPVWPAWQTGTVLFLAGWANAANFGTVTVTGGGGTRTVAVTNLTATLVNESDGIGKGVGVRDPLRAMNRPVVRGNIIRGRGETPIFMHNLIGGVLEDNQIIDTVATGTVAAAFEGFNCYRTLARRNVVNGITGPVGVDAMGLFWDGACQECVSIDNTYRNIRPTTEASNAGAAMASFFSLDCWHLNSVAENCILGFWGGGVATRGGMGNASIGGCDIGVSINNQPAAGSMTIRSNAIERCIQGIRDSSSAWVLGNSWLQNGVDNAFGTLASKDQGAAAAGQGFNPLSGIRRVGAVIS